MSDHAQHAQSGPARWLLEKMDFVNYSTYARFGYVNVKFDFRHVLLERLNGTNEQKLKLTVSSSKNSLSKNGATMKMSCTTNYFGCDCSRYCIPQSTTYCDAMGRRKCLFGFYPNEGVDCLINRNGTDILTMTSMERACSIECRMGKDNILQCDQCGNVAQCYLGYEPDSKRVTCKEKLCKNDSCVSDTYCLPKSVPDMDTGGFYSCIANETTRRSPTSLLLAVSYKRLDVATTETPRNKFRFVKDEERSSIVATSKILY
uniref:DSL domain-containing protein n=1 Tax=Romanomermis culicivorax TaxID=13658 RepID=A0A915JRG3_ROMCU